MGKDLIFISPVDGDVLHANDGEIKDGVLAMRVQAAAAPGSQVRIAGVKAEEKEPGMFSAVIPLSEGGHMLTAETSSGKAQIRVTVQLDYAGYYRLSIDDAVWFLRDLTDHGYESLFDNPFLKFLKEVHELYGTKIHINIYYQDGETFTITSVPDRYREEWQHNADWLCLSFHARANMPNNPYDGADYETMKADLSAVKREAIRFAGEELWSRVTTLHWGAATYDGCRALRDGGYKVLVGDFNVDDEKPAVSYYFNLDQRRNIKRRFIWRDEDLGVTFVRSAIILDTHPLSEIVPFLDEIKGDSLRSPYLDLLIHEQYFYPSYPKYQPDYRDKVLTAVRWATENGYRSAFLQELLCR